MRVLGVDPGTMRTGVAVIAFEEGSLKPLHFETLDLRSVGRDGARGGKRRSGLARRLKEIHDALTEIFKIYQPTVLALEGIFYGENFTTAVRIGEARATAILVATLFDVEVAEYSPAEVKKSVAGNGRASKSQIQYMVKQLLRLAETPREDEADALAVAICHCHAAKSLHV